jgi:ATP-dependent DNA helicase RecQ
LELAAHDGCQVSLLGDHFGEPLDEPCGHCTWCRDGEPQELPEPPAVEISDSLWREAGALRRQYPKQLGAPRSFARYLCGVSSPQFGRARLTSNKLFGALGHVPFGEVMQRAEAE